MIVGTGGTTASIPVTVKAERFTWGQQTPLLSLINPSNIKWCQISVQILTLWFHTNWHVEANQTEPRPPRKCSPLVVRLYHYTDIQDLKQYPSFCLWTQKMTENEAHIHTKIDWFWILKSKKSYQNKQTKKQTVCTRMLPCMNQPLVPLHQPTYIYYRTKHLNVKTHKVNFSCVKHPNLS